MSVNTNGPASRWRASDADWSLGRRRASCACHPSPAPRRLVRAGQRCTDRNAGQSRWSARIACSRILVVPRAPDAPGGGDRAHGSARRVVLLAGWRALTSIDSLCGRARPAIRHMWGGLGVSAPAVFGPRTRCCRAGSPSCRRPALSMLHGWDGSATDCRGARCPRLLCRLAVCAALIAGGDEVTVSKDSGRIDVLVRAFCICAPTRSHAGATHGVGTSLIFGCSAPARTRYGAAGPLRSRLGFVGDRTVGRSRNEDPRPSAAGWACRLALLCERPPSGLCCLSSWRASLIRRLRCRCSPACARSRFALGSATRAPGCLFRQAPDVVATCCRGPGSTCFRGRCRLLDEGSPHDPGEADGVGGCAFFLATAVLRQRSSWSTRRGPAARVPPGDGFAGAGGGTR